ncbi:hypothetical protein [Cellulomonas sp. Leaf334]|uniref:hypothetical protein n=1 Tax=Cellulomonas sp. Leaf334 TaxID=1736339 RepID=UPI0006FC8FEE|nr:hypothetical protein [Cellulomonas sp. Leaf334]KQR17330.1 hypothetical protein ASF78_08575 [Cellulomonas sp. Leaf334]
MSGEREFLELGGPDDASLDRLLAVADQGRQDMGAVRATFRSWPGTVFWILAAVVVLPWGALAVALPEAQGRIVAAAVGCTFLLFVALLVGVGVAERHRVCEHGLVVGMRTKSPFVIPWSTIDPGRVRVVRRSNLLGRLPGRTSSSPHFRHGAASGTALALNGLDSALGGWRHLPGVVEVTDAVRPGSRARRTPFVWWYLGSRHPERIARAVEDAMVADGYPAQDLTDRAVAQGCTLRLNPGTWEPFPPRAGTDPVHGVDGPPQP